MGVGRVPKILGDAVARAVGGEHGWPQVTRSYTKFDHCGSNRLGEGPRNLGEVGHRPLRRWADVPLETRFYPACVTTPNSIAVWMSVEGPYTFWERWGTAPLGWERG